MLNRHRKWPKKEVNVLYRKPLPSDMQTALLLADDSEEAVTRGFLCSVNRTALKRDDLVCKGQGGVRSIYILGKALKLSVVVILTWRRNTLTLVMAWQ